MLIYRLILLSRHKAYDSGKKPSQRSPVPTVCVGNVTVGGTGKTPFTEMLLRELLSVQPRLRLAVLSRGYKRKSKGYLTVQRDGSSLTYGDEPLQIARKFPCVTVAVDKDRVEGCNKLSDKDLIILDDAFQYRALKADLNIVLSEWSRPVFSDSLLPFGSLRDLAERIFAADIIVVSKCPPYLSEEQRAAMAAKLHLSQYDSASCTALTPAGKRIPLLFSHLEYEEPQMVFPDGDRRYIYSDTLLLLTGIARSGSLFAHLSEKYKIVGTFSFPDHHFFSRRDLSRIVRSVRKHPVSALATTEKDAQRLLSLPDVPKEIWERLFAVPVRAVFEREEEKALLLRRIKELE